MNIIENPNSMIAKVGNDGYLVVFETRQCDDEFREGWGWTVLDRFTGKINGSTLRRRDYIWSGARGLNSSPLNAMSALVSMLGAFAEARSSTSENWDLFPNTLRPWATRNSDELAMLSLDIEDARLAKEG